MRIRTDDEVYRVDAVWLGPPKATFPWRARYVAWLIGIPIFLFVLTIQRWAGISFGFFSTAWGFVITIVITRFITAKISHERPLGAVAGMWVRELGAPRERTTGTGGAVSASRVRVRAERPLPKHKRRKRRAQQRRYEGKGSGEAVLIEHRLPGPREHGAQGTPRARRSRTNAPAGR